MDVKVYPSRLAGEIRAVDSKSAAHRAIFAAALCQRPPALTIRDSSDDIRASLGAARAIREGRGEIDCAECGATLRFALPVESACLSDNCERPGAPLPLQEGAVAVRLEPKALCTLLVRLHP